MINNYSYQTQFIKEHNHNKENINLCEPLETEETWAFSNIKLDFNFREEHLISS